MVARVLALAAGLVVLLGGSADAQVYQWGEDGAAHTSLTPQLVSSTEPTMIAASNQSAYFGTRTTVYALGGNSAGQLGNGTTTESETPVEVKLPTGSEVCALGEAKNEGVAVLCNGHVLGWGRDVRGSLCFEEKDVTEPVPVAGLENIVAAAGGEGHMNYLEADGVVKACGSNGEGELGQGTESGTSKAPVTVKGLAGVDVVEITAGEKDSCARSNVGAVYCWGGNAQGQIGDGSHTNALEATLIISGGVSEISTGGNLVSNGTTVAVLEDEEVLAWGDNSAGQYGDGNTQSFDAPHPTGLRFARAVASGESTVFGTAADAVYVAGSRGYWQPGDGNGRAFDRPELVKGITAPMLSATARDTLAG